MDYKDHLAGAKQHHFWFQAKTNLLTKLLTSLKLPNTITILDVGAGTGEDLISLHHLGRIYVLDIDQNALDLIPPELVVEKKCGSACAIPYPANYFDVVLASDVMEHVEHDREMVDEIHRVLKPGGFFIFTVPAFNSLYSNHDRYLGHFRRYNKRMLLSLLTSFNKKQLGYWNSTLFIPAAISRLAPKRTVSAPKICPPHRAINRLGLNILLLENWLIEKNIPLPIGLSLFGIFYK